MIIKNKNLIFILLKNKIFTKYLFKKVMFKKDFSIKFRLF